MLINIARLMKQTARRYWDAPALYNVERKRRLTFGQLHELTNQICHVLENKFGLGDGDRYATLLENDNMGLLHLWMTKAKATALWLGIRDSRQEHLHQIDWVNARLVFMEQNLVEEYYDDLRGRGMSIVSMDKPSRAMEGVHYFWDLVAQASTQDPDNEFIYEDPGKHIAIMRFTGGTTGQAKCTMYSLSNMFSAGLNPIHYIELYPFDRPKALLSTPITHASGAVVLPAYFKGGETMTLNRVDIDLMCQTVEQSQVDLIYTVPTVLYRMLDMGLPDKYDLSSLRTIRYGASPISPAKLEELLGQFGQIFVQGYASTESWPPVTVLGRKEHAFETEEQRSILKSVGSPVPGVEVMICNENGEETPAGQEGEIWIRGGNTIAGYYNDPEQTKANFSENGFWKSGDIGYCDEFGRIYLVDRKKDMIITGGFNVYAQEVENALNAHPAVQNSAVVGVPDDYWGEAVRGVVVLKPGATATQEEIILFCKENLTRYKVPKGIDFVEELPLSAVGKVLRRKVRKNYWGDSQRHIH
ncbi:MAG: AMP-binding protein [Desulfarculus sp.]|nr:AMP-binding protein [Pseudomonadota bacterium]MBV1717318.1 AMP-binding protein [Desulfarculus sp.]MBU4575645.1 AMP-binding protein [Pseudomonadota bacterium]MBU4596905.1 AMP-binding protein [Pseudomonadota bacterium]MBV1739554.1 AMP-binding protein [Desulfarculus sp.]